MSSSSSTCSSSTSSSLSPSASLSSSSSSASSLSSSSSGQGSYGGHGHGHGCGGPGNHQHGESGHGHGQQQQQQQQQQPHTHGGGGHGGISFGEHEHSGGSGEHQAGGHKFFTEIPIRSSPTSSAPPTLAEQYDSTTRMMFIGYEDMYTAAAVVLGIASARRVLVIGSGTGQELCTFASVPRANPEDKDWSIVGVDPASAMNAIAQNRLQREVAPEARAHVRLIQGYSTDLPSTSEFTQFDAATAVLVSHGMPDDDSKFSKAAFFKSITARLLPGAKFFMVDHTGEVGSKEWNAVLDHWVLYMNSRGFPREKTAMARSNFGPRSGCHPMTLERTYELLTQVGFVDILPVCASFLCRGFVATYRGTTSSISASESSSSSSASATSNSTSTAPSSLASNSSSA